MRIPLSPAQATSVTLGSAYTTKPYLQDHNQNQSALVKDPLVSCDAEDCYKFESYFVWGAASPDVQLYISRYLVGSLSGDLSRGILLFVIDQELI